MFHVLINFFFSNAKSQAFCDFIVLGNIFNSFAISRIFIGICYDCAGLQKASQSKTTRVQRLYIGPRNDAYLFLCFHLLFINIIKTITVQLVMIFACPYAIAQTGRRWQ